MKVVKKAYFVQETFRYTRTHGPIPGGPTPTGSWAVRWAEYISFDNLFA